MSVYLASPLVSLEPFGYSSWSESFVSLVTYAGSHSRGDVGVLPLQANRRVVLLADNVGVTGEVAGHVDDDPFAAS
jgi:hypothetical protein